MRKTPSINCHGYICPISRKIIKEQEVIIGRLPLNKQEKFDGLEVTNSGNVKITGKAKEVLSDLVKQYEKLFGQTSIEVCKEAVRSVKSQLTKEDLPTILQ